MHSCTLETDFTDVSLLCTDGLSCCSPMLFFHVAVGLSWIVMFLDFKCEDGLFTDVVLSCSGR